MLIKTSYYLLNIERINKCEGECHSSGIPSRRLVILEKGGIPIEGNYHCSREISL
jgi:hypothetical protein